MKIEVQQVGQLMTNCYIVWDEQTKNAAVIDPGDDGAHFRQRPSFFVSPFSIFVIKITA